MTDQPDQERPVDMSRPVPAAPSPGASWKRAKPDQASKKRAEEKAKAAHEKDPRPRPERVGIRYRFSKGDEDWAVLEDGTHWCFRAGDLEPDIIVEVQDGPLAGRKAVVQALVPTWGGALGIALRFRRTQIRYWDESSRQFLTALTHPGVFWRRDQLRVVPHEQAR